MDVGSDNLIKRTRAVNRRLRKELFDKTSKLDDIRRKPFFGQFINGMATESLGPFPEFILPTHPCIKTMQGYCSPCFFSKVPMSNQSKKDIYDSLIIQTQFIIDHFDEIVIGFQSRTDRLKDKWDVTFCYACNGSLFSNSETTYLTRRRSFEMLANEIEKRGLKPLTYIETCVNDYLRFVSSNEFDIMYPMLKKLNAVISFGFESVHEITRNLIYLKNLSLASFERAIEINSEIGLNSAAFLYSGFHSMTQNEIVEDVTASVKYLVGKKVMPIIMYPNLQEYTLPHLLYQYKKYNLIDPLTALRIFENVDMITKSIVQNERDDWLMGDLFGGPPAPPMNFFSNDRKFCCGDCTEIIRESLQKARQSHDSTLINKVRETIQTCKHGCLTKYSEKVAQEDASYGKIDIIERISHNIGFAEQHCEEYINNMC